MAFGKSKRNSARVVVSKSFIPKHYKLDNVNIQDSKFENSSYDKAFYVTNSIIRNTKIIGNVNLDNVVMKNAYLSFKHPFVNNKQIPAIFDQKCWKLNNISLEREATLFYDVVHNNMLLMYSKESGVFVWDFSYITHELHTNWRFENFVEFYLNINPTFLVYMSQTYRNLYGHL